MTGPDELVLHMWWGVLFSGISVGMMLGMGLVEGWRWLRKN